MRINNSTILGMVDTNMILSHKYKFIFIKTNKTAGTSIEIALSKFCGPDDIITPLPTADEKIRSALGYPGPQNYIPYIWNCPLWDHIRWLRKIKRKRRFNEHMAAWDVKAHIKEELWSNYYKFCFERNPWDRVISQYYWKYPSQPRPEVSKFIYSELTLQLKKRGYGLYAVDGKIVVDKVCKFENISAELEEFRKHVGIPEKLVLPRAKSSTRQDKRSYRDILNESDKTKISELFQDEINLFGYKF